MKNKYLFVAIIALSSVLAFGFTDDDPLKTLLARLDKFRTEYPQEKVHLHFDKPYYTIGDTIWFKAYVVNAEENQLSAMSKILYVDLINERDSVKKSLRLPITTGLSWGDFTLTDSLKEGNYRIRAYTNWMRNFGEEFYFDKTFSVGNALTSTILTNVNYTFTQVGSNQKVDAVINYTEVDGKPMANKDVSYEVQLDFRNIAKGKGVTDADGNLKISFTNNQPFILKSGKINTSMKIADKQYVYKSLPVKSTSNSVDVQFFPESGILVDSVRSKIGFKAVNSSGLGEQIKGYLVDKDNTKIAEIKSEHAGMGSFSFTPVGGQPYTAVINFADGSEKRILLPASVPEGYVLSVSNVDTANLYVKILSSRRLASGKDITLIAQQNGVVKYVSKARFDNPVMSALIPKNRFSTGILQLTLFESYNQPVAERLTFIDHNDLLNIKIATDKTSYGKREKVRMDAEVTNALNKPVTGSFSVAVTNMSKVPVDEASEITILSNLLLTSDIKGYVENPNYYFLEPTAQRAKELDNLMLTQGWRRLEWKNVQSETLPALVFKPEQSISISGKVVTPSGNPVPGGKVTLFATKGSGLIIDTITDSEGRFRFDNLAFVDTTKFLVQARNAKDKKNVEIELDRVPGQIVTKNKNSPDVQININSTLAPYLAARRNDFDQMRKAGLFGQTIVLSEVKITEKKAAVQNSSNLNGAGNADAVIKAEDLQTCVDLSQCLQGRVAGLIVSGGVAYLTRSRSLSGPIPMQIILDGMNVGSDMLSSINPQDVETIEVLKSGAYTAIYGMQGGGGVLVITTKSGKANTSYAKYAPGVITYSPQGYYLSRQFYSPNYDNPKENTLRPDLRTTVYWNPNFVSSKEGKISFNFFTADSPGTYRAVIEGLDVNGTLGRKAITFIVK
ncbi:MAG: TonB-dependent receptor [Sphingobacteriaceae bacterium]|jgi:TonB-dependent SusC/RagA subfamily outer membrane receptor|nr:TonB-dependent receptor [Sphingobacteriaceae bacterium]